MVPEPMRRKKSLAMDRLAPNGTYWCAGCQSFRDYADFGSTTKTTHTQCRACRSAKSHAAMVAKTYGLGVGDYDRLLEAQGGRCAICRARPKSKRLAVDHDHKSGAVRGLLCSRCNHDLMGSAWDSMAMAAALWHYMNTPPATGAWLPPELAPPLVVDDGSAQRPSKAVKAPDALLVTNAGSGGRSPKSGPTAPESVGMGDCPLNHYLPTGSIRDERGHNWRVYVGDGDPPPF